ncbi:MAG: VOC family protein [Thauera sp.]|nr:VOC family protein [Thauera sp.]
MIGYVTLGTKDLPRATAFYDALLGELGARRALDLGRLIGWAVKPGQQMLAVCTPFDGQPASVGNGSMVALVVDGPEQVDALYRRALALGGSDAGEPGFRSDNYYGCYFRDLDGNKLNFFCIKRG